jgi:2-hydroxychromene-2-carboxylate isomerase
MTTPIVFFFDFSLTYSYVANERIDKLTGNAPQPIEAGIQSEDRNRRLCAVNGEARAQSILGAPFLLINQEPFWGVDRFGHLDQQLSHGNW